MAENNPLLEIDGLGSPKEESNPLLQIDGLGETVPDVKKKEQTEPTQAAPLPGLGGVSEEPTPSPYIGRSLLEGEGLGAIIPTKESRALSEYEKNQKAISEIDKRISTGDMSKLPIKERMLFGGIESKISEDIDGLKRRRDSLVKKSDSLIPEARKVIDEIVSSEISGGKYQEFLTEDGTAVDPTKAGDFAREKALEYGLPDDGYFFDLVRNSIESNVESNRIKERVDKNFNDIMQEKHGMGVDDYVKSVVEKSADATGITKLVGERDLAIANVYDNISTLAKNEVEKIQVDRYGKTAEEYASDIRRQYESQVSAINERYSGLMVDGQFTGTQQQFESYKADFESISKAAQEQIDQIVSQEIKDVAAVNAKYDLRYKRQADEIARMYAEKIDEKAKLVDPIIKKEIESAYKSAVGKVYEDEDKAKKAAAVYAAESYLGPAGVVASFVSKPFTKSILDQTSTYLRAAGLQELSETAKLYAKSVDIGEFKLDNADDFLDPLNVIGATGQTIGGMVPTLVPSIAVGVATGGIGWLPTLAAGATGWAVESVGIAQDAYDDRFAATGSASEAEEARDKAWKAQTLILPAYALDNFPIFGKIAGGTAKRIALGALAEYGTELLQEYPQNVFEEVIRNDENLSEAMKYVSFDGFKRTASNLTPVLLIGAGGQARQISAENNIKNAAATLSAKMNIGNMTDSSLEQYMLYLTASKGSDFALAFVDAQLRTGNIAEDVAEKSTNAINNSKSFIDKTRGLKISNESKLALASFDLKIRNAKERVEAETDPMLKSVEETKLKQLEKQASELATTGTTDYAVVAFKNNTFEILTPQELEVMSNNENFISSFSNGDIEVEMFGKNQKQMSDMLNEKVKQEPVAEEDGVNYIESLDDNELVTFNVETIEEVPDKFKEKAVKRDVLSVDVREKILGLPIGKKKKVTVKDGGYSYTITGLEAKEYAKEQQETVPTETKEAAPIEPSGFNPNDNIFNKPELKKNTNYGWRSMGEGEFNELSLGNKIYEGGKPKQGNWISGVPESASEHGGAGKIMVEFGNIDIVGGESMSKGAKAGKDNVTKVWKYNDSTKKFEEAPELLDKLRKSETISESVDSKIAKKESDLQKEVDDFYDDELPSLEKSFPSSPLIKSYEQYKELGENYEILTREQRDVVDRIESRKEEIDSIDDILSDLTNGDITLDEAISKYNNLKPKQDAIQKQAAGKVPVQPEAKAGEKVEKGKPEAEPEKPTQKGKEEVSEEEVNKVADTTGTKPKNIRDLYNINRDMFGQDRVKSLASAIVMDRAIAVMAKRAGISKSEMYSRLQFNKAENVPDGVKFQVDAWHGSPYMFDRFSTQFVGKGVGAMRTGWGLYFTKNEQRTINYAKELSASTIKIGDRVFKDRDKFSGDMFEKINDILEKSNGSRLYVVKQLLEISNRERKKGEKLKEDYRKRLSKEELESGEYDYPLWTETDHYEYRRLAKDVLRSGIEKKDYPSYVYNVAIQENGNWLDFDAVVPDNQYNAILDQAKKENSRFLNEIEKRKGKTGLELYFGVANNFNNNPERELSLLMSRAGIDGNIGRHDTDTEYVVFDENAVSIEEVIKFQKDAEKARGAAMVNMDGTAVIYAMTDPNVSTPLHEIAHVFEHYLTDAERKAIMKFAGTKEWSVETSEKFARGFEKYLADGIAPTAELQKIFDKFKQWMLDIYNGITGSDIDIQLNDEMRDIYDKMLGKEPVAAKTESEKVKAAKDNLNNVWEKWKQSQKNLGVVFDPKSKANEDMELLEAFLTYIKALGIKTAKDIQKAFNDFTGGEATLDDAGAKFVAEKLKPKKGETNYEKTEDMNREDLEKRGKSLFNAAKKLFMDIRRTFVKFSSDTRELLKSTTDIRPVYDYFVARLGSPGNANLIFQDAKKKIYDGIFPNLRRHLDSLIKYRRIITINESRVESNRKGLNSLKASEMFEKAGDEAVNAFNEAVSAANDYANSTEQQALDARGIRNEALRSLRQSEWYRSLSEVKQKRFEKQFREDLGFLKNENFTGKDSNGNPIGLSVAREMLSEIESVVGEKDFKKINERADAYFNEFRKMLEKDLNMGIISQEQYDAMIGKDYSPRVFIQHMFGFDGEFIENIDDARLMKEYSLSSDAIRTLREGLKDLNTDEAYWELITDSEKLLAGYISSRERRYAFNDLNRKMVDVLSKLESEFNELKKNEKLTKEERLRYKKLGNILDAFSTKRKRGMSSANYYENGEKKSFYIRDDIFKQWYDMRSTVKPDSPAINLLDNLLQTPQRILQSFATGEAAPFFFIFNTARDFIQLSVISDVYGNWTLTPISMAKAIKDFAKGVSHIYKDDALYREAMENGVGMDFLYMEKGLGLRKMMKDSLLKLAEKSDITRAGSMALIKGVDAMSTGLTAANRYSELGFRMAIYERVRDSEYKKIEDAKGEMTNEEYLEAQKDARKKASAASRDFMNFSEGGSFTKKVNPYASYLNAAVIGTDTVVKEFRKNPPAFTFRVTQGTTILSTVMLGIGLMMLNMFDEDDEEEVDGKDKKYGTLKKYYKILDSINPYYRNKFYIIPTGKRDENGNYEVIRIAKNPALIPISYAAEKALRYNLEKQLLGSEERYISENLEKDALEINYLFHEYVMPINLSPVDENGKIQDTGVILSSLVQKNIPLSLMMITMTGYDPYTNRYISPEKKYQSELDSKYLIGWNDPEIQGFYKDMAMELNTSITPKEMKVMVEKVITRPENNPIIASVYSMLDRNNKTSDIIKKDRSLVSDILNMTKKVAVISADYEEYAKKPKTKKIEQKIREHKEEKYATSKITKTVVDDIIKKVKNKEIDALDTDALVSEMDKMVSTQIDVFKEANVEISEKDEMEIRHKVYRNAVPALNLPELPTQYKLTYVVDMDPVVMAYRFFEDFGDVDVQGDQFKEISAQMMNEYRSQYNSVMSKDKFNKFLTKYIEAKNDPELIGD